LAWDELDLVLLLGDDDEDDQDKEAAWTKAEVRRTRQPKQRTHLFVDVVFNRSRGKGKHEDTAKKSTPLFRCCEYLGLFVCLCLFRYNNTQKTTTTPPPPPP
jgi:hypothetical protein